MTGSRRRSNYNRNSGRGNFDRGVDKFFEAGRQLVDGVSGTRPGSRKTSSFKQLSRTNIKNVGNWVTDKLDNFFEEDFDEEWNDDFDLKSKNSFKSYTSQEMDFENFRSNKKKPLEAISLRLSENFCKDQKRLTAVDDIKKESWEDDSYFQLQKWQRPNKTEKVQNLDNTTKNKMRDIRNLPRSSRRRV